jgi:hypothetical protein
MSSFFSLVLLLLISATGVAVAQTPWIASDRSGGEVRFLYQNQIRRYDLASKTWLSTISLPRSGATAMAADATGAVVVYGAAVYRYGTGFTDESIVGTVSSTAQSVYLDGNLAIVVHSTDLYSRVTIFDRSTSSQLSAQDSYVNSLFGSSHAPGTNRLYGRTQGISPGDIVTASYTDAGVLSYTMDSPYHGTYAGATRTWCFPDESRVVDSSGTVYTAPSLKYFGSFAGAINDISFNEDIPVVLRGAEVIAYTANLLEAGRAAAGTSTGAELQVTATEAFVFSPGATVPSVNIIPLATLNAPEPHTPVDPNGLAFTVDDAFPDKDGNLLILSKTQLSLFRWSPAERKYTATFPLQGVPEYAGYSKENHSAYFVYDSKLVSEMDLSVAAPKESPLLNLPSAAQGFATAGEFLYAAGGNTLMTFSPAGDSITTTGYTYYLGNINTWDPVKRRVYHFRDGISPNDLHYDTISASGTITTGGETPYHGDFAPTAPIRLSPNGERLALGSGVIFETAGLTKTANLANSFTDAVWTSDGKLSTLRLLNGVTQLQTWEGDQLLPSATVRQFSGTPTRLFQTPQGLTLITSVNGMPQFTILDSSLATVFVSPIRPLAPGSPALTARTVNSMTLQWQDLSDNEELFRVEYRQPAGSWVLGTTVPQGSTSATVAGLTSATTFEFRVIAVNGGLDSAKTATVTGETLAFPDQPTGEPYNLRVTRIFNDRITLEWQDNAGNETTFRILRSTLPDGPQTTLSAPANTTSFTSTSLASSTAYYFRIQAINGALAGDLSAQVKATTLGYQAEPTPPSGLNVKEKLPFSVKLAWTDRSTNEDHFRIERSAPPSSVWTTVGTVDFNVTSYADQSVQPNTAYSYRVRAVNSIRASSYSSVSVTTPKLGGEFVGHSMRGGDVYYFVFNGPDRIVRYDLAARSWLPAIPLLAPATAFWVDDYGIFVAEDRALFRYALDGTGRTPIGNAATTIKSLFTLGDVLAFGSSGGNLATFDKKSGVALASFSYYYAGTHFSVAPSLGRVFFRSTDVSPSDISYLEIGADGKLRKGENSPYHGTYPSASRTFVFPNGVRVADDSGIIYATNSLSYNNSLGGSFTDLDFLGADIPVVLRNNKLVSYTNSLLEAGSFTLAGPGLRVAVSGTDAVVFTGDGTSLQGLSVRAVPLTDLAAPEPGPAVDPRGLAYTPDDVFIDRRGEILLLSKSQLSLFRWSPAGQTYLPSLPLLGAPSFAGYSAKNDKAYFAYDSQVVREMDLATAAPKEAPLVNLPFAPRGFTLADGFPYVAVGSGALTFTPGGESIAATGPTSYTGSVNTWDPVKRRVYHFRDGISPNDLHYDSISATGAITGGGKTPYHEDFNATPPIRVSPDGTKVVIGSGVIYNAADLVKSASLANGFTDAQWFGGSLVTARMINGVSQLQTWNGEQFLAGTLTRQFSGTPLRLLVLDASRLLLISLVEGVPRFTILNSALEAIYISPTKPVAPTGLAVTMRGTETVALAWADNSDNELGFRIDYRTAGGSWLTGTTSGANVTSATVAGLTPGTSYDFRVSAAVDDFSAPSAIVTAKTLSSPDEPVGEPYGLQITRTFATSMTLEWQDNAINETGFRIFYALTPGGPTKSQDSQAGSTVLQISGLTPNTLYYFSIQVLSGASAGDLSGQVSGTTRISDAPPSAPSSLKVAENAANFVKLEWTDTSTNEGIFRIERNASGTGWISLAEVPYNTTAFTDATVTPATAYNYRLSAVNASGSSFSDTVSVTTAKLSGDFAGFSIRAADVYYFAFTGPNRIERYDLAARAWLPSIPLEAVASALWADKSGIYVAEQRALIRFALNGTGRTHVSNAGSVIRNVFSLGDVLVFGNSSGAFSSLNEKTGLFLANFDYRYSGAGFSVSPGLNRAFFRSTGVSPSDIHYVEIGADGKLVKGTDSPYHGAYPGASRTFVFPNGARVADDSGTVYSTDSLSYTNSLGGSFSDLAFYGQDIPVVLRGNKLQAYTNVLLEAGSFTLETAGLRVAVAGSDALVFTADATSLHGLKIRAVPIAEFSEVVPGKKIEPSGLAYTPEEIFVDRDGGLLMFSKANLSLFRWSPAARGYVASLPLLGSPKFAAYSAKTHRAYFAYDTNLVREMDLNAETPTEKPLFNLPQAPTGLATAGEFIFAADPSGAWSSHYIYSSAGTQLQAVDWNYYSRVWEWEPVKRRMYFFRDDTSPNDLHYETIDTTGKIAGESETPYHGSFNVAVPIRASRDGGKVAIGSGVVFETTGMTRLATLSNGFVDAVWRPGELLTVRASGTQTQLQRWNDTSFAAVGTLPLFDGTPLRLLTLNSTESALVTLVAGVPQIYLLNNDLAVTFVYKSQPVVPTNTAEDEPFAWNPTFQWGGLGTGPITVTTPVLPDWLTYQSGNFTGTPGEGDGGDQVNRTKIHRLVVRAANAQGQSQEMELQIPVAWRNDAPVWTSNPPPVSANNRAAPSCVDLASFMGDPDGRDVHRMEVTEVSGSPIFSKFKISEEGILRISYAPYVSGSATVTTIVTDASGASATTRFKVILPKLPIPLATIDPAITFSRATGLYSQVVTVKNIAARPIGGFDLTVSGLGSGVSLYNATTKQVGGGVFSYNQPLAAGQSVKVVLKYFTKSRGSIPQPKIVVSLRKVSPTGVVDLGGPVTLRAPVFTDGGISEPAVAFTSSQPQNATNLFEGAGNEGMVGAGVPFAISDFKMQPGQMPALQFHTDLGWSYRVQYSDDMVNWKTCPEILTGIGGTRSWSDSGPPLTDCPPTEVPSRFYRIERFGN